MIVDASVAVKWLVVEEDAGLAVALIGRCSLIAPDIIASELANAMWKKCRRGELTDIPDGLATVLDVLDSVEPTPPLMARATQIAVTLDYPAYDCFYLALAELRDDRVVTADIRFLSKLRGSSWAGKAVSLNEWAQLEGVSE